MTTPMHPATLEEIRARVAKTPYGADERQQVLEDRGELLEEVDRLRAALAGHLFDGESVNTREAIRSGMITMGITAYDALRGVTKLVDEIAWHEDREGCAVDMHTPKGWVDVKDRLAAVLAAADPSPAPVIEPDTARR